MTVAEPSAPEKGRIALSSEAIISAVIGWFDTVRGASMELPSGWFGRPYDHQLSLVGAEVLAGRLLLDLDGELLLVLAHPRHVSADRDVLRIADFRHGIVSWDDYGNGLSRIEVFGEGEVRFHAPQG